MSKSLFLYVLTLCTAFCLLQIPTYTNTITGFKAIVNDSLVVPQQHIKSKALTYYASAAVASVAAPLVSRHSHKVYLLPCLCLLAVASYITFHNYYLQHILLAVSGGSYSALFITSTSLITDMTPRNKLARNFSLLSAFYGCSFIIYGVATAFSDYPSDKPYMQQFCLVMSSLGTVLFLLYAVYYRLALNQRLAAHDTSYLLGDKVLCVVYSARCKLCLLLLCAFYSFITTTLYKTYTRCCYITPPYGSEALICYGSSYMMFSIYSSYHHQYWYTGTNTILSSIMFFFGYIIMNFLFKDNCPVTNQIDSNPVPSQWVLIPLAGIFVGSGTGLLNSQIFTLVSQVWDSQYRFSMLVLMQSGWGLMSVLFYYTLQYYLLIATVLTVVYFTASLVLYHEVRACMSRLNKYQTAAGSPYKYQTAAGSPYKYQTAAGCTYKYQTAAGCTYTQTLS